MTRKTTFLIGLGMAAFWLASCATIATPQRCEQAAAGLNTVAQIAAVLVNAGIEQARAEKLAQLVATGQMLVAAACAQGGAAAP